MLIRYYKTRGHELAELDPLRLVNYKEFGKVYVKNNLEHDLNRLKIMNEKELDVPFTFPSNPIFHEKIACFLGEKSEWTMREIHERLQKIYSDKAGL
jgi:2-oxoglutarate dehydrogenase complex dehydrogenase (E1) component-like enzyme